MRIINQIATSAGTDYINIPRGDWVVAIQARTLVEINVIFSDASSIFTVKSGTALEFSLSDRETRELGIQADAGTIIEIFLIPNKNRTFKVLNVSGGGSGSDSGSGSSSIVRDTRANIFAGSLSEDDIYYAEDTEEMFVYNNSDLMSQSIEYQDIL